ncbi:arginine/serine-rich coiled-coil protein 2-like [Pempheris klunzingeri]|uniref:arginine/serine-rich coiled-coil protein 2-like n=1 Tax=Pempheris klunzingeri TaxID=3127111 RepID=UPI00397FC462
MFDPPLPCMSHCVADGSPNDSSAVNPASGLQNAAEVSTLPPTNAPSESSFPPEPNQSSKSKKEQSRHSTGTGKHHHSNHRHRSPNKKTSTGNHKGGKSKGASKLFKKKDDKGSDGHRHHSSGHHRRRHRSPDKGRSRTRSAENTLDSGHGGHRHGRSPDRRHGHHSSSHHRHRSPYRSPYRSPHRHRSPHRSRHHSPTRRHPHSSDPYRRYASPERQNRSNEKPNGDEAVLKEPTRTPEPSLPFENSILHEPPALDRLNREATLPPLRREERLYGEDSLLMTASSMERAYRGDSLLKDVASRGQRDAYRDTTLPRVRTPDSDSAYKRYSSLLRGRSPERTDRDGRYASRGSSPEPQYRTRSLGRDFSPVRSSRREDSEDEEDDDNFVAAKVREYYSTLKTNTSRSSKPAIPEPKKTYKENPKDLSI